MARLSVKNLKEMAAQMTKEEEAKKPETGVEDQGETVKAAEKPAEKPEQKPAKKKTEGTKTTKKKTEKKAAEKPEKKAKAEKAEEKAVVHVKLSKEQYKQAKLYCVENDISLSDMLGAAVVEYINRNK